MNNELILIENELVPVYETSTGEKVVYGTELYEVLDVKSRFNDWVRNRLNDCEAIENEDFQSFTKNLVKGGRPTVDYVIKLDIAKEMAMLERNEKGKQVRRYFIEVEKKYKANKLVNLSPLEQLQLQSQAILEVNNKVLTVDEKVSNIQKEFEEFKQDMPLIGVECDKITTAVRRVGTLALGGKNSNAYHNKSLSGKVYTDIYKELKRQFQVSSYKSIKRSQCDTALNIIQNYKLPVVLKEQINNSNAQLNMGVL